MVKKICLLTLLAVPLLALVACNDIPTCKPDNILMLAESLSPDCPAPIVKKHG